MNDMTDITEQVIGLINNIVGPDVAGTLHAGSALFDERILDSFGLIQLVGEIDRAFSVAIPTAELTMQNFATPASIAALVSRQMAA